MLTHCFSNKGKSVPYIPITPQARYSMAMGYSYQPKKNTSTVTELGGGTSGTANNLSSLYYPEKSGGQVFLNNTTGYDPSTYKTITIGNLYTSAVSYVIGFELVARNAYFGSDIVVGHYNGTYDYWMGTNSSYTGIVFSAGGAVTSTGTAVVDGRKYIVCIGVSSSATGFFNVYDSAGNAYTNSSIGSQILPNSFLPAIGSYGTYLPGTYIPRIYVGDFFQFNTLISTTNAVAIKDAIKWKYGIS